MGTLKQEAESYEPKTTHNVADLPEVPLDLEVSDGSGTDDEGKEFHYKFVTLNNEEYRVPKSVLLEMKKILKLKPETKSVKVKKQGSGLSTRYEVEPLN